LRGRQVASPIAGADSSLLELAAGIALLLGWQLRYAAGALALFCIATALGIHLDLADRIERTLFLKDIALAGALIFIAVNARQSPTAS